MSTTTPSDDSSHVSLSPDTPRHHRDSTSSQFSAKYDDDEDSTYSTFTSLADEMCPFFFGPIPPQAFLDSFMPPPSAGSSFTRKMFDPLIRMLSENKHT